MNNKLFTVLKVGFTWSKMYGLSGEYFQVIYTKDNELLSLPFTGMYGSEGRIKRAMEEKGYKYFYTTTDYGQMTRKDILNLFKSENEALEYIKTI
jgi:hypothetical protein